jgi:hypothetical protein
MRTIGCTLIAFSLLSGLCSSVQARVLPGAGIRVAIEGKREAGIGLRGDGRGWRLPLGQLAGATQVVLVDVTSPTHDKWVLPIEGKSVVLDGSRFVGGHAYRIEVLSGMTCLERGLVYLYPSRGGRATRVAFDVDGRDTLDDSEIRLTPKSAL